MRRSISAREPASGSRLSLFWQFACSLVHRDSSEIALQDLQNAIRRERGDQLGREPGLCFCLLTVFFAFLDAMFALADFFVGSLLTVFRRGFRSVLRGSCLVDFSPDVTKAASFPAALPIVVAAFIRTPLGCMGATFFFAIPSFY